MKWKLQWIFSFLGYIFKEDTWEWVSPNDTKMKLEDMIPVSWIHTHVASAPCGFSSIDMHTQYAYEWSNLEKRL